MSKIVCSNCRFAIQDVPEMFCLFRKLHTKDGIFDDCDCFFPKSTFDRITASPEVLAENVVYPYEMSIGGSTFRVYWTSPFVENFYPDKAEALAATVAKLKKVVE